MNTDVLQNVRSLTISYDALFEVMSKEALATVPLVLRTLQEKHDLTQANALLAGVYGFYRAFYNIGNHIVVSHGEAIGLDNTEFMTLYNVLERDCKTLKDLFGTAEIAIDDFKGAGDMREEDIRRKNLEDIDAILANEGFRPDDAPSWYKELKAKYIRGEIASEEMTKQVLENL